MIRLYRLLQHAPDHGSFQANHEVSEDIYHYLHVRETSGGEIYWRDCFPSDFASWGLPRYSEAYGVGLLRRNIPDGWQMMTEDDYIVLVVEKKLDAPF